MAFVKKAKDQEQETTTGVNYSIQVTRARIVKDGLCFFDMVVNGVTIYGCTARDYRNAEGKEGTMISLPSYKGTDKDGKEIVKDGKPVYYNHVFFPMSAAARADILKQIESLV